MEFFSPLIRVYTPLCLPPPPGPLWKMTEDEIKFACLPGEYNNSFFEPKFPINRMRGRTVLRCRYNKDASDCNSEVFYDTLCPDDEIPFFEEAVQNLTTSSSIFDGGDRIRHNPPSQDLPVPWFSQFARSKNQWDPYDEYERTPDSNGIPYHLMVQMGLAENSYSVNEPQFEVGYSSCNESESQWLPAENSNPSIVDIEEQKFSGNFGLHHPNSNIRAYQSQPLFSGQISSEIVRSKYFDEDFDPAVNSGWKHSRKPNSDAESSEAESHTTLSGIFSLKDAANHSKIQLASTHLNKHKAKQDRMEKWKKESNPSDECSIPSTSNDDSGFQACQNYAASHPLTESQSTITQLFSVFDGDDDNANLQNGPESIKIREAQSTQNATDNFQIWSAPIRNTAESSTSPIIFDGPDSTEVAVGSKRIGTKQDEQINLERMEIIEKPPSEDDRPKLNECSLKSVEECKLSDTNDACNTLKIAEKIEIDGKNLIDESIATSLDSRTIDSLENTDAKNMIDFKTNEGASKKSIAQLGDEGEDEKWSISEILMEDEANEGDKLTRVADSQDRNQDDEDDDQWTISDLLLDLETAEDIEQREAVSESKDGEIQDGASPGNDEDIKSPTEAPSANQDDRQVVDGNFENSPHDLGSESQEAFRVFQSQYFELGPADDTNSLKPQIEIEDSSAQMKQNSTTKIDTSVKLVEDLPWKNQIQQEVLDRAAEIAKRGQIHPLDEPLVVSPYFADSENGPVQNDKWTNRRKKFECDVKLRRSKVVYRELMVKIATIEQSDSQMSTDIFENSDESLGQIQKLGDAESVVSSPTKNLKCKEGFIPDDLISEKRIGVGIGSEDSLNPTSHNVKTVTPKLSANLNDLGSSDKETELRTSAVINGAVVDAEASEFPSTERIQQNGDQARKNGSLGGPTCDSHEKYAALSDLGSNVRETSGDVSGLVESEPTLANQISAKAINSFDASFVLKRAGCSKTPVTVDHVAQSRGTMSAKKPKPSCEISAGFHNNQGRLSSPLRNPSCHPPSDSLQQREPLIHDGTRADPIQVTGYSQASKSLPDGFIEGIFAVESPQRTSKVDSISGSLNSKRLVGKSRVVRTLFPNADHQERSIEQHTHLASIQKNHLLVDGPGNPESMDQRERLDESSKNASKSAPLIKNEVKGSSTTEESGLKMYTDIFNADAGTSKVPSKASTDVEAFLANCAVLRTDAPLLGQDLPSRSCDVPAAQDLLASPGATDLLPKKRNLQRTIFESPLSKKSKSGTTTRALLDQKITNYFPTVKAYDSTVTRGNPMDRPLGHKPCRYLGASVLEDSVLGDGRDARNGLRTDRPRQLRDTAFERREMPIVDILKSIDVIDDGGRNAKNIDANLTYHRKYEFNNLPPGSVTSMEQYRRYSMNPSGPVQVAKRLDVEQFDRFPQISHHVTDGDHELVDLKEEKVQRIASKMESFGDLVEIGFTICYKEKYSILNRPLEDKLISDPIGIMSRVEFEGCQVMRIFQKVDELGKENSRSFLFSLLASNCRKVCFEAQSFIILVLELVRLVDIKVVYSWHLLDHKIGMWLLDPEHPVDGFPSIMKTLGMQVVGVENESLKWLGVVSKFMDAQSRAIEDIFVKLSHLNLWDVFEKMETFLVPILANMEQTSVKVDYDRAKEISNALQVRLSSIEKEAWKLAGKCFSLKSPAQLRRILYEDLKLDKLGGVGVKTTAGSGAKTTDEGALKQLSPFHPLPALILEYRRAHKIKTTYIDGILQYVVDKSYISTSWEQCATSTGRITSNKPNLQSIPKREEDIIINGKSFNAREIFVARPGYVFIAVDFQQIEMRVFAHLSQDKTLISAFDKPGDIFSTMTQMRLGTNDFEPAEREKTKTVMYALFYGAGINKIAEILSIPKSSASQICHDFYALFPSIRNFRTQVLDDCRIHKELRSLSGRRRLFLDIASSDDKLKYKTERMAVNFTIQGSAADIFKAALIRAELALRQADLEARLLLQIHDELLWEVEEGDKSRVADIIRTSMENTRCYWLDKFKLKVNLPIKITTGYSWGRMS